MTLRHFIMTGLLLSSFSVYSEGIQNNAFTPALGEISFPTSANSAAELYFKRGVLFLHSFEYDQARVAFQQAEKVDPTFALAYWGEAMTYNQPLWNDQDLTAAKKALAKLAPTDTQRVEKTKTTIEKGFIKAVNLLFGEGAKAERDSAYADSMRDLYRQDPNNDEIGTLLKVYEILEPTWKPLLLLKKYLCTIQNIRLING